MQRDTPVQHARVTGQVAHETGLIREITHHGRPDFGPELTPVILDRPMPRSRMTHPQLSSRVVRFDVFEVDFQAGELRKESRKVKLQEKPFRVLSSVLRRTG